MPQSQGRVLIVDDDVHRLAASTEALQALGYDVITARTSAEARVQLQQRGTDLVIATETVATELADLRSDAARHVGWIVRVAPLSPPPQRGLFIASVSIEATPRAIAETVSVAMMVRRAKRSGGRLKPFGTRPTPDALRAGPRSTPPEPALDDASDVETSAALESEPLSAEATDEPDTAVDSAASPSTEAAPRPSQVAVLARDSKVVRRLCECFEEGGLVARGFTSGRTVVDVASSQRFDALLTEERLHDIDASLLADRIAALGARAPRIVVLARAETQLTSDAIAAIVRAPATPPMLLEAVQRVLGLRESAELPTPHALPTDDARETSESGDEATSPH